FDILVKGTQDGRRDTKGGVSPYDELNEGVAAQLMAHSEMMVNDASELGRASAHRMDVVRLRSFLLVLASASLLILSAVLTTVFLTRNIAGFIDVLKRGTQRIAAGDLDYRLETMGHDELGKLGEAFNNMSARLQDITVSKERLQQEVEVRRLAEEALREARDEMERRVEERTMEARRQADLIDLSHEAIIVRDLESRAVFWNKGAEEAYGWTREEALGQVTHVLLNTKWPLTFEEHMADLTREGRWEGVIVHTRKDGSTLIELSRQVLRRESDIPSSILEINIDITDRITAEEETRKHAAQLEASNRELQDFAFVASHDLQEPLRKIRAFGDQLRISCGERLDAEEIDYLERMQNAAFRMEGLIRALLNYSRVTTKAKPFSPTDLTQVAHAALADLVERVRETAGTVEVDPLGTIDADSTQMGQLFQNLIGNALKFHGKERPAVRVYGMPQDGSGGKKRGRARSYTIFVEDNGIGFDEKYLDRIFAPFQRLHGRTAYEGTGIGLAICRKIVDRHGGTITAKSIPGKGSTFMVTLPVKQPKGGKE
ncbi:MAG TPA: ATP-binding protein, partial [Syntrophorhabdaceae bacterium]